MMKQVLVLRKLCDKIDLFWGTDVYMRHDEANISLGGISDIRSPFGGLL